MLEEVLNKLEEEGKTMLISTHDVDFAYRWTDRAIVFCGGQIIADDTPLNVFRNGQQLPPTAEALEEGACNCHVVLTAFDGLPLFSPVIS